MLLHFHVDLVKKSLSSSRVRVVEDSGDVDRIITTLIGLNRVVVQSLGNVRENIALLVVQVLQGASLGFAGLLVNGSLLLLGIIVVQILGPSRLKNDNINLEGIT